jgi:hypothetical protein
MMPLCGCILVIYCVSSNGIAEPNWPSRAAKPLGDLVIVPKLRNLSTAIRRFGGNAVAAKTIFRVGRPK